MLARLPSPLAQQARHVFEENARVDTAVDALALGELAALGVLLDRSHASLRDLYAVSTPQAVEAAVATLKAAGAAGARMIGGGFGGHVLALMAPSALARRRGAVAVRPGPGASVLER